MDGRPAGVSRLAKHDRVVPCPLGCPVVDWRVAREQGSAGGLQRGREVLFERTRRRGAIGSGRRAGHFLIRIHFLCKKSQDPDQRWRMGRSSSAGHAKRAATDLMYQCARSITTNPASPSTLASLSASISVSFPHGVKLTLAVRLVCSRVGVRLGRESALDHIVVDVYVPVDMRAD